MLRPGSRPPSHRTPATPGRSMTPGRPSTPGDLAPLALAPVDTEASALLPSAAGHGALHHAPPSLPRFVGDSSSFMSIDAPADLRSLSPAVARCEEQLKAMAARQVGVEQRLAELSGVLEGLAVEQTGHARRLDNLGESWHCAQSRLTEIDEGQRTLASEVQAAHLAAQNKTISFAEDPLANHLSEKLREIGRRVDAHEHVQRSSLMMTASLFARRFIGASNVELLRISFREWSCACEKPQAPLGPSASDISAALLGVHEARASLEAMVIRVDEHDRKWVQVLDTSQKHGGQLAKTEASLSSLRSEVAVSRNAQAKHEAALATLQAETEVLKKRGRGQPSPNPAPAVGQGPKVDASSIQRFEHLAELLVGQAKAIEDLEFVIREELDELRASRSGKPAGVGVKTAKAAVGSSSELPEAMHAFLFDRISEQGVAIEHLSCLIQQVSGKLDNQGNAGTLSALASEAVSDLPERLSTVEEAVASMQQHLSVLAVAVRRVRDHAAEAFADRVAVAVGEVQQMVAARLSSVQGVAASIKVDGSPESVTGT